MYLRFVIDGARTTRAGVRPGLFRAASAVADRLWDEPLGRAIDSEVDWFNRHLPVPRGRRAFAVRAKGVWHSDGVCWFRPGHDAREAIAHAHLLAVLLREAGVPIERIATDAPGQILYRDPIQVVAKPDWHYEDTNRRLS